jgi:uridine kinase
MEHEITTLKHYIPTRKIHLSSFFEILSSVFFSPFFYVSLFLKIGVSFFLASSFATGLFIPFIEYFVTHPFINPYQHFLDTGVVSAFPYPFGMLAILSIPFVFFGMFGGIVHTAVTHIDLLLLRLPLLLCDIGILLVLLSWFKRFQKEVLILYWMSPVLFYISYIHGQLDVVPIFFLFAFLYFLTKEHDYVALMLLGIALSTKTGMVIIVPFVLLYLIKERKNVLESCAKILIPFIVFVIIDAPVLLSKGFIEMVFKTKEEFKVFDLIVPFGSGLVLYVVPGIILLLLFRFAMLKRYSRNVLMVFLGFSFFILLLCIAPRQGWYFWIIPFAVYFYAQSNARAKIPLHILSLAYFMYFAVAKDSDFFSVFLPSSSLIGSLPSINQMGEQFGLPMGLIVPLSFTFLQGVLLLNIYGIYKNGIAYYTKHKLYYKPFLIGIAGDSGSGKTTLAKLLSNIFSARNTTILAGDDMHKWERGNGNWQDYTHLDPLANELHADIKNVYALKRGNSIMRRQYDHATGGFTRPKKYEATRLVIFEGLHVFFLDKIRKAFDLKIYIAPEDQLRLHWKIIRDTYERGYTKEQILAVLEKRKDDSEKYIAVQEKHSDIVISFRNAVSLGQSLGKADITLTLSLFITCANDIYLQPLFDEFTSDFSVDYLIHDEKQRVKLTGYIMSDSVATIAEKLLPELDDISTEERVWEEGYQGVIQLFIAYYMFQQMALENYND